MWMDRGRMLYVKGHWSTKLGHQREKGMGAPSRRTRGEGEGNIGEPSWSTRQRGGREVYWRTKLVKKQAEASKTQPNDQTTTRQICLII